MRPPWPHASWTIIAKAEYVDFDAPPQTNAEADLDKATAAAAAASQAPAPSAADGDPEEVDISTSEHFYKPNTTARSQHTAPSPAAGQEPQMSEDALRQMMMGFDPAGAQGGQGMPNPFGGAPGANGEEDPIMKMMSQMMGGAGGPGGSPFPGMNGMPDLSNLTGQAAQKPVDFYTALWRLLHAIVAIGLGLYITTLTPFTGTKIEREHASLAEIKEHEHEKQMFFWVFATAEACLLTTRFFLDKGRAPPGGIVWTVIGFLPEPFKGYVEVMARYGQIFTTVRSDILGCMFVLGVCHWLRA